MHHEDLSLTDALRVASKQGHGDGVLKLNIAHSVVECCYRAACEGTPATYSSLQLDLLFERGDRTVITYSSAVSDGAAEQEQIKDGWDMAQVVMDIMMWPGPQVLLASDMGL